MVQTPGGNDTLQDLVILLIENDPAAAFLTKEALKEAGQHESVTSVSNGEEALAHLAKLENQDASEHPDVIFLDLHLPRESGLEVLEEIKRHPAWKITPVVVVSGSSDPREVRRAYELHASCFIRKPSDLGEFLRFMRICYEYWGSVVTLPETVARRYHAGMATVPLVSVEEYLHRSYRPDRDYIDGVVEERHLGQFEHSTLQYLVLLALAAHAGEWGVVVRPQLRLKVRGATDTGCPT